MTGPLVSLPDIKAHLRLSEGEMGGDDYLEAMIGAAQATIETFLNRPIAGDDLGDGDRMAIGQAIRLIVGNWYINRESTTVGGTAAEAPMAVAWLLRPLRRISTP